MSPAERFHPAQPKVDRPHDAPSPPPIETVYTTVEAQSDRTDWLTVVSNLRQTERQLVEQIARLEQALASTKQDLHNRKEENQNHEITILQQQDELTIARDRVGALFQQLENSHQIGQRQQTLIETISQQLEISQAIIPQLEAENEELNHKLRQQAQKLDKTERVAVELHRRLKLQTAANPSAPVPAPATTPAAITPPPTVVPTATAPAAGRFEVAISAPAPTSELTIADPPVSEDLSMETGTTLTPLPPQIATETAFAELDLPTWTPAPLNQPPSGTPSPANWREAVATNNARYLDLPKSTDRSFTARSPEPTYMEIDEDEFATTNPAINWPSPTLERTRPIAKTIAIDLPKFPKKQES